MVAAAGYATLAPSAAAHDVQATLAQQRELAERYAPVVRLVVGREDCGPGLHYVPIDVGALFDELDGCAARTLGKRPRPDLATAKDLGRGLWGYHLDFPGNALQPGCDYLHWQQHLGAERDPTTYAHIASDPAHPGKLALQYWFFYVFNDWNNLHEGDWEMIQIVFDASTVEEALHQSPVEVGYSQHEGAERAAWDDPKLERVGTHPVVHPADGSQRELLRRGAVSRQLRLGRGRLRRHARTDRRRAAGRGDDPERPGGSARAVSVDRVRGALG